METGVTRDLVLFMSTTNSRPYPLWEDGEPMSFFKVCFIAHYLWSWAEDRKSTPFSKVCFGATRDIPLLAVVLTARRHPPPSQRTTGDSALPTHGRGLVWGVTFADLLLNCFQSCDASSGRKCIVPLPHPGIVWVTWVSVKFLPIIFHQHISLWLMWPFLGLPAKG